MHTYLRHRCAPAGFGPLAFVALLAGCGQPVREDRSINWSNEGGSIGFQPGCASGRRSLLACHDGLYRALGQEKEQRATAARLKNRSPDTVVLPVDGELGKAIITLHTQMQNLLRQR